MLLKNKIVFFISDIFMNNINFLELKEMENLRILEEMKLK